jgi:hypothetical protein
MNKEQSRSTIDEKSVMGRIERSAIRQEIVNPLSVLGLSARPFSCIRRVGINTVEELMGMSAEEMLQMQNFGQVCLDEVMNKLDEFGRTITPRRDDADLPSHPLGGSFRSMSSTPISELNLSQRPRNCLIRAGINTVEELVKTPTSWLMALPNFGQTSFDEIVRRLGEYGIDWGEGEYRTSGFPTIRFLAEMAAWGLEVAEVQTFGELFDSVRTLEELEESLTFPFQTSNPFFSLDVGIIVKAVRFELESEDELSGCRTLGQNNYKGLAGLELLGQEALGSVRFGLLFGGAEEVGLLSLQYAQVKSSFFTIELETVSYLAKGEYGWQKALEEINRGIRLEPGGGELLDRGVLAIGDEEKLSYRALGQHLGVSYEAIRRRCIRIASRLNRSCEKLVVAEKSNQIPGLLGQAVPVDSLRTAGINIDSPVDRILLWAGLQPAAPRLGEHLRRQFFSGREWLLGAEVEELEDLVVDGLESCEHQNCLVEELVQIVGKSIGAAAESNRDLLCNEIIESSTKVKIFKGMAILWTKNYGDKAVRVLHARGEPMQRDELAEAVNPLSKRGVINAFQSDDRVVVVGSQLYALDEWGLDGYEGVFDEILQEIDRSAGSASYESLVGAMRGFGIKENTVKAYVECDAFVLSNGFVSTNPTMYKPRPVADRDDLYVENGLFGQRIVLEENNFRGYSLKVSFDIAFRNGIRPNDDLVLPVVGFEKEFASVIWRPSTLSRTVDVGRLSALFVEQGHSPGEPCTVVVTKEFVKLSFGGQVECEVDENGWSG